MSLHVRETVALLDEPAIAAREGAGEGPFPSVAPHVDLQCA